MVVKDEHSTEVDDVTKSFIALTAGGRKKSGSPGANVIKLFTAVSYEFS